MLAAITFDDQMESYSNLAGEMADHFIVTYDSLQYEGDYSGTSFAAPTVAGAVGLVSQKFPELTAEQKKTLILHTADDLGAAGVDDVYGHGKLNITNAMSPIGGMN